VGQGRRLITGQPDADAEELDDRKVVVGAVVVSGRYPSGVIELAEEPFDQIAIAVEERAEGGAALALPIGWDVGEGAGCSGLGPDGVTVSRSPSRAGIALAGQQHASLFRPVEQTGRLRAVAVLRLGEGDHYRSAFSVDQRM